MSSLSHHFSDIEYIIGGRDDRAIVFIDANFSQWETLIQRVTPETRVIVINPQANGINEITKIMNASDCQTIYLVCRGVPGCLYLGNQELSLNTLIQHGSAIQSWFNADRSSSDTEVPKVYLYGCAAGVGDGGTEFITKLSSIVGATVTASIEVSQNRTFNYED